MEEQLSLPVAFDRAFKLHSSSQRAGASCTAELLRLLEHCQLLVARAALFSRNEEQDDLTTASMRYLLVPALLGDVHNAASPTQSGGAAAQRRASVQAARAAYTQFLQRAAQYQLLGDACQAAYEAMEQGAGASSSGSSSAGGGGSSSGRAPPSDPGAARAAKLARFRRAREVAGLIGTLQERQQRPDEQAGTEGGAPGGVGAWDEEDERRLWAAQLEAAALRALDALPLLEQEAALLAHAAQQQQQHGGGPPGGSSSARQQEAGHDSRQRAQPRAAEQQQQQQQQMMHRLADIAGQLSLGRDRQALHRQVLRPGHILPTLTVEQQGDVEVAQARARDRAAKEAAAAKAAAAADARSDDEDEAALAKQRAWDDWADDNPRGWGNSKLRPCA